MTGLQWLFVRHYLLLDFCVTHLSTILIVFLIAKARFLHPRDRPPNIRRCFRTDSRAVQNEQDQRTETYGNETIELRGTDAAFRRPWHRNKRWWIRWPAKLLWAASQLFNPWGQSFEFRPASYWWSRWIGYAWRTFERSGRPYGLFRPLLQSRLNLLLIFLPLTLVAFSIPVAPDLVVASSFLATIPLSGLVHLACEDISASVNDTMGKLLVAFSDNLVELIVSDATEIKPWL